MLTVDELIAAFRSAANAKADFAEAPRRDYQLHARMTSALHQLRQHGAAGESAFRALLNDGSPHVRGWVAAELLSRGDPDARAVLADLSRDPGLVGFNASMTLREFDAGHLSSPFPS